MEFFRKIMKLPETAELLTLLYKLVLVVGAIAVSVYMRLSIKYWIGVLVGIAFIPIDFCLDKLVKLTIKKARKPGKQK